jgi:hypothetical protein
LGTTIVLSFNDRNVQLHIMRIPLPQVLAGVLVARQANLLPSDYCSPECREYPTSLSPLLPCDAI